MHLGPAAKGREILVDINFSKTPPHIHFLKESLKSPLKARIQEEKYVRVRLKRKTSSWTA